MQAALFADAGSYRKRSNRRSFARKPRTGFRTVRRGRQARACALHTRIKDSVAKHQQEALHSGAWNLRLPANIAPGNNPRTDPHTRQGSPIRSDVKKHPPLEELSGPLVSTVSILCSAAALHELPAPLLPEISSLLKYRTLLLVSDSLLSITYRWPFSCLTSI